MYILMIFICGSLLPAEYETETAGKYPDNFVTEQAGEDEYICKHSQNPNADIFSVLHIPRTFSTQQTHIKRKCTSQSDIEDKL